MIENIDIRFAIADEDYAPLSKEERIPLLAGLGDYLLLVYSVAGQIYRSTDCGHTWTKLSREFGEVRVVALAA